MGASARGRIIPDKRETGNVIVFKVGARESSILKIRAKPYEIEAMLIPIKAYNNKESRNPAIFTLKPNGMATNVIRMH